MYDTLVEPLAKRIQGYAIEEIKEEVTKGITKFHFQ